MCPVVHEAAAAVFQPRCLGLENGVSVKPGSPDHGDVLDVSNLAKSNDIVNDLVLWLKRVVVVELE